MSDQENEQKKKHRFEPNSKYFTIMVYGLMFVACTLLIYAFIGNLAITLHWIGQTMSLISPFILGGFIAFILYPLVRWFFRKVYKGLLHIKSDKISKVLSILSAYIIAIGAITILLFFIIPQIYQSIIEITEQLPSWYQQALDYIADFEARHSNLSALLDFDKINAQFESALPTIVNYLTGIASNLLPMIFTTGVTIVKGIFSFIIGVMVSVYMISDHRDLFYHGKRLLYAVLPKPSADTARNIILESGRIFTQFIFGKALDSLIIGLLTFIAMTILRLPFAVLISVLVGVTNMIPYFGPYFGGAVGFLFILIVSPIKAIIFAVLILVIQQFDGLFLGPKILGDKTGLSPLWVIFSITVGGSLFGVVGMFLGVPCVAVLSYILNLIVGHFLRKKNVEVPKYESKDRF